ncbi:MAG: chemotaxis protein CheW [Rhodospirillales bacterium]|jgi:purine-binding chemotaxis protein CheW|nr:chemotaxis protein CheW [Rhodospirillales bacterium]
MLAALNRPTSIEAAGPPRTLVIFALDGRRYALPLSAVERVVRIVDVTPLPQAPDIVDGVINIQGIVVPVVNIRRRLGLLERQPSLNDRFIVARLLHRRIALAADTVTGVINTPSERIDTAQSILPGMKYFDGVLKLDDDLVLIQDLTRFLSLHEEEQLESALRHADEP